MNDFYLLIGEECPLCQLAIRQIHQQELEEPISLHLVDIQSDKALIKEYGALIPVLVREKDNKEMKWPFDNDALKEFLSI